MSRSIRFKQLQKAYKLNGDLIWRDYEDVATYPDEFYDDERAFINRRPSVFESDESVYII